MKHYLYIVYSATIDRFYCGETEDVVVRLQKHNSHHYKGAFTKIASDWSVRLAFTCDNKEDALFLEAFVKRMKSKKFIKKVIDNPSILSDILSKR